VIITPDSYMRDPAARELADRILEAGETDPCEVFEIYVDEGAVMIGRYRVIEKTVTPTSTSLRFKIGADGYVESYWVIYGPHGWTVLDRDEPPYQRAFR
jgi:hypothetical protein